MAACGVCAAKSFLRSWVFMTWSESTSFTVSDIVWPVMQAPTSSAFSIVCVISFSEGSGFAPLWTRIMSFGGSDF